jgi:hypothetical protein
MSDRTPLLCDLSPGGRYNATDMFQAGGTAVLAQRLKELGILNADAPTVLGKTVGELADEAQEADGQQVVRALTTRSSRPAAWRSSAATSRRRGCVVKLAGHERRHHAGPARVFEGEEAAMDAVTHDGIQPGDVVIIRNEGPPAAPACARCSRHRGDQRRGPGGGGRAAHRRALQRRHARASWPATSRPRRPRRPDRAVRTATPSRSTSTPSGSTSTSQTT